MTLRPLFGGMGIAACVVFAPLTVLAADLPPRVAPAPYVPAAYAPTVYNWTGFYIGGHAGGGFANSSWSDPFTGASNSFNKSGFLGGGQVGANVQFNALVLGAEGDFTWTGLKGSSTDSIGNAINTNTDWTSTITGRVGVAFDRLLAYGKGGVAFAHDQSSLTDLGGNTGSTTLTRTGWTAGGGLEYALDNHWSARVEYDYLGFGSQPLNFTTPVLGPITSNATLNVQEVKAGINFRFGP
jgi:outer membrane immunogenic protein